ncbi:hypothetical protein [Roseimaritima sediminicola]|uniref:hypothetical protein n=1 Tax=Roseimaritima sediminicola TaxID=2662066 RepID=UPI0012985286|nr:hypothetical protein [Roseimaritima sediminicola]
MKPSTISTYRLSWTAGLWLSLFCGAAHAEPALRSLEGRFATVVTDLPAAAAVDGLPADVDAAVPQWLRFWQRQPNSAADWKMTIYVMQDRARFEEAGLFPPRLPDFPYGFQSGREAWVLVQPSDYYTRHLVLHEAFHGFAERFFGGTGPQWFAEGTAEMMATHRGSGPALRVPSIPATRQAVPYWGRFRVIAARREEARIPSFAAVLDQPTALHRSVEPYAWSWAAVVMLTMYPEYREALIEISDLGADRSERFTRGFRERLPAGEGILQARWQLLLVDFDYGYDTARGRVRLDQPPAEWDGDARTVEVAADRGWQAAGVRVRKGTHLRVTAEGRYSLGDQPRPWTCEPQGVTVRYHRGRPLGMILAALVPESQTASTVLPPVQVEAVGREATVVAQQDSWLFFRVGDDPSQLADNSGLATVRIQSR